MLEMFTGWESANKYRVFNTLGQDVFFAREDNDCCTRMCCGPGRPFEMNIVDNIGREIIHIVRPLRCQACCFPCCLQELEIQSPPGQVIGSLEQQWSFCQPRFLVKDERGEAILSIEGPGIVCDCCSDIDFNILSLVNESEVRDEYRHCLDFFDFFLFRLEKLQNNGQESDGKCSRTHKTSE